MDTSLFKEHALVEERFTCLICQNVYEEPVMDRCPHQQHTFCRVCIDEHMKNSNICPVSKQLIDKKDFKLNTEVLAEMLPLALKCANAPLGCKWVGKFVNYNRHYLNCPGDGQFQVTEQVLANEAGGGPHPWRLDFPLPFFNGLFVREIYAQFTPNFNDESHTYHGMCFFKVFFTEYKPGGQIVRHESLDIGAENQPELMPVKKERVKLDLPKRLNGIRLHLGKKFILGMDFRVEGETTFRKFIGYNYPAPEEKKVLEIPPGGVLCGLNIQSGWMIEGLQLVYATRTGDELIKN